MKCSHSILLHSRIHVSFSAVQRTRTHHSRRCAPLSYQVRPDIVDYPSRALHHQPILRFPPSRRQAQSHQRHPPYTPLTPLGDGFGVGWYGGDDGDTPCIFTSISPAWNNLNLTRLAEKISSPLVFAHVRASTGGSASSELNCHPWSFKCLMWMHNGNIAQFSKIKRRLQSVLDDDLFNFVQGNTDSEWAFALFLTQLDDPHKQQFTSRELKDAMLKTIALLNQWAIEAGVSEPSFLNFAVTDGRTAICTRYINHKTKEAASLYFSSGSRFEMYKPGHYRMVKADKREDMVVIASEPLTFEKTDWLPIPSNTVAVVTANMNVLLYPVQDAYSCVNNKRESWE